MSNNINQQHFSNNTNIAQVMQATNTTTNVSYSCIRSYNYKKRNINTTARFVLLPETQQVESKPSVKSINE